MGCRGRAGWGPSAAACRSSSETPTRPGLCAWESDVFMSELSRESAATVGALIVARTAGSDLTDTPLAALPTLGRRLSASAKRNRGLPSPITLWTVERSEALAGFRYLSLFTHPAVPGNLLTPDDACAVGDVALALARALLARKGPKKLDREEVDERIQPDWLENFAEPPDERWILGLKRRAAKEDALRKTSVRPLPVSLRRLLPPPDKYR